MIIEIDAYKKNIPNYDPAHSEDFHSESAKMADKDFYTHLKISTFNTVIFLAGGTASGKSEFASLYLQDKELLVYDGTLKNTKGFEIKFEQIRRLLHVKSVKVVLIIPRNLRDSLSAFLARDRKMSIDTFITTHIDSKKSVLYLFDNFKDVVFEIYFSVYTSSGTFLYFKIDFDKELLTAILKKTESDLAESEDVKLLKALEKDTN